MAEPTSRHPLCAPGAVRHRPEHLRPQGHPLGVPSRAGAPSRLPAVVLSTALVLAPTAPGAAADLSVWTHRHRGTLPTDLRAIAVSPSGSRVVAVGTDGGAAWSHDGGASWSFAHLGTAADATGVAFQDDSRVWATGELPSGWTASGVLLRSDDGGRTWTTAVSDHPVPLTSVAFADADHGVAGQPVDGFLETTDGGTTWVAVGHPGLGLAAVEFVDPLLGLAAGTGFDFTLSRTTDGGSSWTQVYTCPDGTITGLSVPDGLTGYLASPVSVARTVDAGASWSPRAAIPATWIDDLAFADPLNGWIGGIRQAGNDRRGTIVATSDGGATWSDRGLDEPDRIAALAVAPGPVVLGAGGGGTVLRSTDGGVTFRDVAGTPANHLRDLLLDSATAGWAVGPTGAVHRTTDGGRSWTVAGGHGAGTLESVVRATGSTLYACGSYAFVASDDDGASWQMRYTYLDCHVLWFETALVGLAGTRYGVFRTDDGGTTWTIADNGGTGTGGVFDLEMLDASHGFAAAGIGTVLETVDGGLHWQVVHSEPPGFISYLLGIDFSSASVGWAVGMDGVVLKTTDGGASWVHQSSGTTADLHDVRALGPAEVLVVGEGGLLLTTSDGGASWQIADSGTSADLWAIALADPATPLVSGDWGTLLEPGDPALVFADGFESGDSTLWSTTVP